MGLGRQSRACYALDTFSSSRIGFKMFALLVSTMHPLVTISSAGSVSKKDDKEKVS